MDANMDLLVDIIQEQQRKYEMFGFGSHLIYDSYPSKVFLEMKIDLLMPNCKNKSKLIDLIWSQKYFRGNVELCMSPIFVYSVKDADISKRLTYPLNIKSKHFSVHLVFRVQKCNGHSVDANAQNKCCAIFVDEFNRVYQNWNDFLKNNEYDDGLVVAPKRGIYNGAPSDDRVLLDIVSRKSGVTKFFDIGSAAVGLGAAVVPAVALIPAVTVAPVALACAGVAGASCALYTGVRSIWKLIDRKSHKQSIGLKDNEARNAWLNVGIGVVSASSAGATQLLARAARNGRNISNVTKSSAHILNVGAIVVNTGACLDVSIPILQALWNGEFDKCSKEQMALLGVTLYLLSHSVNNSQMAKQLMAGNSADSAILCLTQKESFKSLVNQTGKVFGCVTGPIVRSVNRSVLDPQMVRNMIGELLKDGKMSGKVEAGIRIVSDAFANNVVREYVHEFDKYLLKIIQTLERKLNIRNLNSKIRPIINLLRDMTFKACNKFLAFIEQFVKEITVSLSIYFERFIKCAHLKVAERSAIQHTDLNSYILSSDLNESQLIGSEIQAIISDDTSLNQIESMYDAKYGFDSDLSESRKLELLIDEYAEKYTQELEQCSPAVDVERLHETVISILKQLPHEMAEKFFVLAKCLIINNASYIHQLLGRFISVEIFVVEIYCLLVKLSAAGSYESLIEYLSYYNDYSYYQIEKEFKRKFAMNSDRSLKKTRCSICSGEMFVFKKSN